MALAFIRSGGIVKPALVKSGGLVIYETLTDECPDRYEIGKLSKDQILAIAVRGNCDVHFKGKNKDQMVELLTRHWNTILRNVRRDFGVRASETETNPSGSASGGGYEVQVETPAVPEQGSDTSGSDDDGDGIPSEITDTSDEEEGTPRDSDDQTSLMEFLGFDFSDAFEPDEATEELALSASYMTVWDDAIDFTKVEVYELRGKFLFTLKMPSNALIGELKEEISAVIAKKQGEECEHPLTPDAFELRNANGISMANVEPLSFYVTAGSETSCRVCIKLLLKGGAPRVKKMDKDETKLKRFLAKVGQT